MELIMNTIARSVRTRLGLAAKTMRATAVSACVLLGACASLQPTHTGFLNDYESLHQDGSQPNQGSFRESGLDVGRYRAFMVAPVVFELAGQPQVDPRAVEDLKAFYRESLRSAFAKKLREADAPGRDVMIVRAAVTGLRQAHPVVNALTMAAVFVPVTAGAASSEAEIVDSVSGERLAALQGVTNGGRAVLGGPVGYLSTYGQARRALSRQADELAEVFFGPERGGTPVSATTAALVNTTHLSSTRP
jgi:hypothetical protein